MKLKQHSDIVIGDITSGSYHLTDLEALSMGKPTFSYLDSRSQFVLQNLVQCESLPFVNCRLEEIEAPLIEIVKNNELRKEIGAFSRDWIERYYDDKNLVKYYIDVYEKLMNNEEILRQDNLVNPNAKRFLYNTLYDMQWEDRVKKIEKILAKERKMLKKTFSSLIRNIFSVQNEYKDDIKRKVIRFLGIKFSFKVAKQCIQSESSNDNDTLKVSFYVSGGFGDYLINANYIYNFCKFIKKDINKNIQVDVISPAHQSQCHKAVFKNNFNYIDHCYIDESPEVYDVSFKLHSLLELIRCTNEEKIQKLSPHLYEIIKEIQEFDRNYKFFAFYHTNAYHIALANGKTRLQLADISGKVGVQKKFNFPVIYTNNEEELLEKLNLKDKRFITLNRGIDKNSTNSESTKMWSLDKYNEVVKCIKEKYSNIVLVQIGASKEKCKLIDGIDIDLRGRTTLEDIKVLIKNSIIHIDCEGGFAHLRAALNAPHPAVVIFGPTSPDFYGYSSNINVYARNACPICCDWIIEKWQQKCLRNIPNAPCMNAVTAQEVFSLVDEYLQYKK